MFVRFYRGASSRNRVQLAGLLSCICCSASTETIGKIAALWFPTMAFVALGMEHCIANMFFIPLGILTGTDPRYIALAEAGKAAALKADFIHLLRAIWFR